MARHLSVARTTGRSPSIPSRRSATPGGDMVLDQALAFVNIYVSERSHIHRGRRGIRKTPTRYSHSSIVCGVNLCQVLATRCVLTVS